MAQPVSEGFQPPVDFRLRDPFLQLAGACSNPCRRIRVGPVDLRLVDVCNNLKFTRFRDSNIFKCFLK